MLIIRENERQFKASTVIQWYAIYTVAVTLMGIIAHNETQRYACKHEAISIREYFFPAALSS